MRMLLLVLLACTGACDLQPPPKKQAPSQAAPADVAPNAAPDAGAPVDSAPTPPPASPVDAGAPVAVPSDAMEITAACNDIGVHVASTIIDEATELTQKAALEQTRTRLVRRTAEACTRDRWSEAKRACFQQASTTAQMQDCGRDLPAPRE